MRESLNGLVSLPPQPTGPATSQDTRRAFQPASPTNNDTGKGTVLSTLLRVDHADKGPVGSWLAHRSSMDQIPQGLYPQVAGFFTQHKADGIHEI